MRRSDLLTGLLFLASRWYYVDYTNNAISTIIIEAFDCIADADLKKYLLLIFAYAPVMISMFATTQELYKLFVVRNNN